MLGQSLYVNVLINLVIRKKKKKELQDLKNFLMKNVAEKLLQVGFGTSVIDGASLNSSPQPNSTVGSNSLNYSVRGLFSLI